MLKRVSHGIVVSCVLLSICVNFDMHYAHTWLSCPSFRQPWSHSCPSTSSACPLLFSRWGCSIPTARRSSPNCVSSIFHALGYGTQIISIGYSTSSATARKGMTNYRWPLKIDLAPKLLRQHFQELWYCASSNPTPSHEHLNCPQRKWSKRWSSPFVIVRNLDTTAPEKVTNERLNTTRSFLATFAWLRIVHFGFILLQAHAARFILNGKHSNTSRRVLR